MDTTPTTVLVTNVRFKDSKALFEAVDEQDQRFLVTLRLGPYQGAKRWFAHTVSCRIAREGKPFPLTSTYDADRDEWFTRAGNYGIHSRDLSFQPVD